MDAQELMAKGKLGFQVFDEAAAGFKPGGQSFGPFRAATSDRTGIGDIQFL